MKASPQEMVRDTERYRLLTSEARQLVDVAKRLPDFVFRRTFARYYAIAYAYLYREEFGNLLSGLANACHDETVNYITLDPTPEYFYHETSFYGVISFSPSDVAERYVLVMHPTRGADKILAGSNVGMFWGSSLKWSIAGDRISWELAIIGVSGEIDIPRMSGIRCMSWTEVIDYIKSQYRIKDPSGNIASEFAKKFLAYYPSD